MERICQQTGGRMFEVSKKQPIDKIYADLQEELRNQYNLGFTPAKSDAGFGYRRIALATKNKDLRVQARDGYYADREGRHERKKSVRARQSKLTQCK